MLYVLFVLGCTPGETAGNSPAADTSSGDTSSGDTSGGDTGAPCTPVEALFFDLGETLVSEGADGLHAPVPGADELLDALEARAMPMGVITNVPASWDRDDLDALLVDPQMLDRFDVVLLSSEASAPKPDPAIFVEAVALLSTPADIARTAFVTEELGDLADAQPPTEGARAAGMLGVHVSAGAASALADHTVAPDELASLATAGWLDCLEAER